MGGPPARYLTKELGSVVIRGKGAEEGQAEGEGAGDAGAEVEGRTVQGLGELEGEPEKMLMDARFVIGDHVCVGIFPGTTDGLPGVLPPREALLGGAGPGAGYGPREGGSNGFRDGRGAERGGGRFGGQGTSGSYRGRGFNGLDARGPPIPAGEWSRGERLPEERRRHGGGGGGGGYPSGPFRNGDRESR